MRYPALEYQPGNATDLLTGLGLTYDEATQAVRAAARD